MISIGKKVFILFFWESGFHTAASAPAGGRRQVSTGFTEHTACADAHSGFQPGLSSPRASCL